MCLWVCVCVRVCTYLSARRAWVMCSIVLTEASRWTARKDDATASPVRDAWHSPYHSRAFSPRDCCIHSRRFHTCFTALRPSWVGQRSVGRGGRTEPRFVLNMRVEFYSRQTVPFGRAILSGLCVELVVSVTPTDPPTWQGPNLSNCEVYFWPWRRSVRQRLECTGQLSVMFCKFPSVFRRCFLI